MKGLPMSYPANANRSRDELRQCIIDVFSSQDDIYRISFFGRETEGQQDKYSDVDVVVYSNELACTQAKYKKLFASISPIRAAFPLDSTADGLSEMIMLRDYNPYQKVDFSIGDNGKKDWQFLILYDDPYKQHISLTTLESVPIVRDTRYVLTDVIFSVARFTKCLFRREIDMYRRWVSISEISLALLFEKHFGWNYEMVQTRLGNYASKKLFDDLDTSEKMLVNKIRPPNGKPDIAESYQVCIELIIELSEQKAQYFGLTLDHDFIDYILSFLKFEMVLYRPENHQGI
jgi:predicted nucleotidyltransferase